MLEEMGYAQASQDPQGAQALWADAGGARKSSPTTKPRSTPSSNASAIGTRAGAGFVFGQASNAQSALRASSCACAGRDATPEQVQAIVDAPRRGGQGGRGAPEKALGWSRQ